MNVYPEWKQVQFNKGYIDFEKVFFEGKLIFRIAENVTYVYLKDIYEQERVILILSSEAKKVPRKREISINFDC